MNKTQFSLFLALSFAFTTANTAPSGSISYKDIVNKKVSVDKIVGVKGGVNLTYTQRNGEKVSFLKRPNVFAIESFDSNKVKSTIKSSNKPRYDKGITFVKNKGKKYSFIKLENINDIQEVSRKLNSESISIQSISPVLYSSKDKSELILNRKINIKFKDGMERSLIQRLISEEELSGLSTTYKKTPFTNNQYQLFINNVQLSASKLFNLNQKIMNLSYVDWAEPEFTHFPKKKFIPNDPKFSEQWHLQNNGQSNGLVGADINAEAGWDISSGEGMIIAAYDDGFDLNHPDLTFWTNEGESGDGKESNNIDDDNNGYIDDYRGWDFAPADNDPSATHVDDVHGTAVAGVAAANGNNNIGVVGSAFSSIILPLRLDFENGTSCSDNANAMRYAGKYADVVTNSWNGPESCSSSMDEAIDDVVNGKIINSRRGKKGTPILFASGNSSVEDDSGKWYHFTLNDLTAGSHTFTWVYNKDSSFSQGHDTVWLDDISWPDGTIETFDNIALNSIPPNYSTSGDADWSVVADTITPSSGRIIKAGTISDDQLSTLTITRTTQDGDFSFSVWVSSEYDYDYFDFVVDGWLVYFNSGDGSNSNDGIISYPASSPNAIAIGASNDGYNGKEERSSYSQFGPTLDIVAPSSRDLYIIDGGITTTDYSGVEGYDETDYTSDFGGTSSATPLAAGVVANILETNPLLSASQARLILKLSASKITGLANQYEYNNLGRSTETGFGRLDMLAALQLAQTYHPSRVMKRGEIAKPLLQLIEGNSWTPPAATGTLLDDISTSVAFADWIEELYNRGISEGCSSSRFCPDMIITKEQISKLTLKAFHYAQGNTSYTPPDALGGIFDDINTNDFSSNWIEELRNTSDLVYPDGFTEGCNNSSNIFCPKEALTWEGFDEMRSKIH